MSLSNYAENKLLDVVFNQASSGLSANLYVKLHTGDPGEDCTSNAATETTRKQASFAAASGGSIASDGTLTWTNVAATETYTHASIWDHATVGNPWFYGAFTDPIVATINDTVTIPSGNITATLS